MISLIGLLARLIEAAVVRTLHMVNEYFGVGVTSVAMDGVAPELNPGWVHRRTNTYPEVRYASSAFNKAQSLKDLCVAYLVSIAFPSTGHPDPIRALRHPWLRLPRYPQGTC